MESQVPQKDTRGMRCPEAGDKDSVNREPANTHLQDELSYSGGVCDGLSFAFQVSPIPDPPLIVGGVTVTSRLEPSSALPHFIPG